MILEIDTKITHKILVMIPGETYHANKNGFKEIRSRHGLTDWVSGSWFDGYGNEVETHFQKRYKATERWSNYDGDVLVITSDNQAFINSSIIFWETRGASVLDMTDRPRVEVLVNGESVRHEVVG